MNAPEFSRFKDCGKLPAGGRSYQIEADESERQALTVRFSLVSLDHLSAGFKLLPGHKKRVLLQGRLKAKITQSCVVTLKPVITELDIAIERTFTDAIKGPRKDPGEPDEEGFLSTGGQVKNLPDQPDLLVDGGIDLGEVASQQLAIEIDPFPRLDSAAMEDKVQIIETQEVENRENPFAVLQGLKKKLK